MSLLDDITGAVNGIMTQLPELTGTCLTETGVSVTVIFTNNFITQQGSGLGLLNAPSSSFDVLQANIPATGMNLGDRVTLTDSQGVVSNVRLLSKANTLNFVTFTFEAINQ